MPPPPLLFLGSLSGALALEDFKTVSSFLAMLGGGDKGNIAEVTLRAQGDSRRESPR